MDILQVKVKNSFGPRIICVTLYSLLMCSRLTLINSKQVDNTDQ